MDSGGSDQRGRIPRLIQVFTGCTSHFVGFVMLRFKFILHVDIDECSLGISACHGKSACINTQGWYRCDCLEGYHSNWPDNHYGSLCMGKYLLILINMVSVVCYGTFACNG